VFSVFVIFTSLIDGAQNFYHQGELLHQCARKLATVHHNLKNIDVDADNAKARSNFADLQKEYAQALDECPINHANVDFYHEKVRKPNLFPDNYKYRWITPLRFWYWIRASIFGNFWVSPHIAVLVGISIVVYIFVISAASPIGAPPVILLK
jgi:hypothetical protein